MDILLETINPYVLLGCILLGYIVKTWTNNAVINNKLIPTIVMVVGAISYYFIHGSIEMMVVGGFVGLGSTGCHQLVTNWISLLKEKFGDNMGSVK